MKSEMKVKKAWNNSDFPVMGWHDCSLYSIQFPFDNFELVLDIDYIFEWEKVDEENFQFQVSPCVLTFFNVMELCIDLNFKDALGIDISSITRQNERPAPNGKVMIWDFQIVTDKGTISFETTGYTMEVLEAPICSEKQSLGRG